MEESDFVSGVRDVAPALPPNIPFGLLFGATAVEVGIGPVQATAMSLFVFAGAAQMAAVDLLRADAALSVVLTTVLVLNLRYMMYGASLAPTVRELPARWRATMGYALSDVNYALAIAKFSDDPADDSSANPADDEADDPSDSSAGDRATVHQGWYYLGLTVPFVISFVGATAVGAVAGMSIGDGLNLDFAIPLIFIALLAPALKRRGPVLVAVTSGMVAVPAAGIPFNLGLFVAAGAGIAAGTLFDRLRTGPGGA
ncbi:AzlC family ABC transporter permease [Halostagnicola bangensis]